MRGARVSAAYVREQFRAAAAAVLVPLGFAWFESMNVAQRTQNLPARWFTLDFSAADESRAALGVPALMREQGSVVVQIFTEQQITDDSATAAADAVRDAFTNWADVTGQLRVMECLPAVDVDSGDLRGAFYSVFASVRYQFDRLVAGSSIPLHLRGLPT